MPARTTPAHAPDGSLSLHPDWFTSCWTLVLPPRHQAMVLAMLFATAMRRRAEGSLDDIAFQVLGDRDRQRKYRLGDDGLDSPLLWLDQEGVELAESPEEAARITAAAAAHRQWFEEALRSLPHPAPSTVRDLAAVMQRLGLARESEGRWSVPDELPRPDDVLPLPADLLERIRRIRRHDGVAPAEQALLAHFTDTLRRPERVSTSLQRLERATGLPADRIREALDHLADEQGDLAMYRGDPPAPVAARNLPAHARFQIVVDWRSVAEDRIQVVRA
ncbi:DUF6042 family protein [Streptomyces sp. NPDC006529]|uniref:DUF6042 family protein n=1 Tax=Streptomyces sp. NPDC006529 TaxID=3157177 RepID=UPI0033B7E811